MPILPEQLFDDADIQIHQDETSGQLLVVKRMKLEEDVEEFVTNEVAIARVLTSQPHPNIVTFKESYVTESECLLVMEHCSGGVCSHLMNKCINFTSLSL